MKITKSNFKSLVDANLYPADLVEYLGLEYKGEVVKDSTGEAAWSDARYGRADGYSSPTHVVKELVDFLNNNRDNYPGLKHKTILDLGASVGFIGAAVALLTYEWNYVGIEINPKKVKVFNNKVREWSESEIIDCENVDVKMQIGDLTKCDIPKADVAYYYYSLSDESFKLMYKKLVGKVPILLTYYVSNGTQFDLLKSISHNHVKLGSLIVWIIKDEL